MAVDISSLPSDVTGWDRLRRPVWLFDVATRRGLYANATALELWGSTSLEELLSRDFSKLSPAVLTRLERLVRLTAEQELVTERWTFYPNGSPMTVQAVISAFPLRDGRSALLFEAAPVDLEEEERRAVEALRHTSTLITVFGVDGRPLFSNPAAFAAYGGDQTGFVDRFVDPLIGAQVLAEVLDGQVIARFAQVRTAAGERAHHLDARQGLDPVTGEASLLLSERDVTAQVEAEKALVTERERAEVAVTKQRFLANMSHELRTPLNSVLGYADLLAADDLTGGQQAHVSRIAAAGESLLGVINDVITLSELDLGDLALDQRPFDPAALLDDALASVRQAAEDKGLILHGNSESELPDAVAGDGPRLGHILRHFLSNAVKFTNEGSVTLQVEAAVEGANAAFEIAVIDTGPGLDAAQAARLFQRFAPADDGMRKTTGGAGLGLAISMELATLMGADVGVDSEPGLGSRFWIRLTLPLADAPEETADETEAVADDGPLVILYADDNDANRKLVQAMLATQGHRCDLVCDGSEAVDAVRDGAYDLVLMDIQMPVMDGVAATRAIRDFDEVTPILALTANTLSDQLETYEAAGMNDCIAKPVAMVDLLTKTMMWGQAAREALAAAA